MSATDALARYGSLAAIRPLFELDALERVTQEALGTGQRGAGLLDAVTEGLARAYPGLIHEGRRRWIANGAGGALGQMSLLHASPTEYMLLWSTPIGTSGHSGRYPAVKVHDIMLEGTMDCFRVNDTSEELVGERYEAGETAILERGSMKGYRSTPGSLMLEYGHGFVPSMLPFGLIETFTSTLDFKSLRDTLRTYTVMSVRGLIHRARRA